MRKLAFPALALAFAFNNACIIVSDDDPKDLPDGSIWQAPDGGSITPDGAQASDGAATDGVVAADGPVLGPCGVPEMEPNDDRDRATPYTAGVELMSCLGKADDVDYYEITAPAAATDPSGGYYQLTFSNVGDFTVSAKLFAVADNGEIQHIYAGNRGQNTYIYLAAAPGQKYRIAVAAFSQVGTFPAKYTMKATYTKVNDTFEANDTRATAKPLAKGMASSAYFFAGHKGADTKVEEFEDWYSLNLDAGMVTVRLENVPMDVTGSVYLFDAAGTEVKHVFGSNKGASVVLQAMPIAAGTYYLRLGVFSVTPAGSGKAASPTELPDSYTRAYTVTVTQ